MDKILINILKKIEKNGYEAYIVGGYVRDKLMGIETSDIDICTNALPKDIIRIFRLDKDTKEEFGCVRLITKKYNIDIIVMDPPRSGSDKKSLKTLLELNPKKIIYISCNPVTLARDINILSEKYEVKDISAYDMFPQTYHVECVCVLNRQ